MSLSASGEWVWQRGGCRQIDQLGGKLAPKDSELDEETTVKIGEQTDMDILEAERTGCGGDPSEKWEKE